MKVTPGCFLISRPAMLDPNFDGTVVMICTHDEDGTVGLTINRPLDVPIEQVLPDADYLHDADVPLLWGGPVGTDAVHVLSGAKPSSADSSPDLIRWWYPHKTGCSDEITHQSSSPLQLNCFYFRM